jgi:homocysteine S-methyltransferase
VHLEEALGSGSTVLTEGAVVERLRRDPAVRLDPELIHAGFVYDPAGAAALDVPPRDGT